MTSFESLTPVQNRERYFGVRRRITKAAASPPTVHPDNPLLQDEPDDLPNQLHHDLQGYALKVEIPRFAEAGDTGDVEGFLRLTWDGTPVGDTFPYITPIDAGTIKFDLDLPEGLTSTSGPHELGYILNHGGNPQEVTPLVINIDTQAPMPAGMVTVPPDVDRDGITKAYLDANGFVLVGIPEYANKKIGDKVTCYFGSSLPLPVLVGEVIRTDPTVPVTFNLTAVMVGGEEGEMALYYYTEDRKGNRSTQLHYKVLNVTLTDPPQGLLPPSIPLFDDDVPPKLVDLADARTPLGIGIETAYTNYIADRDELEVTVDGIRLLAQKINGFPFYIDVSYSALYNGDLGEKTISASYQIKRGTVRHPLIPLTKDIVVDLRRAGPGEGGENPNPDLDLVTVQGQGGNAANVLTVTDKDQTVSVKVPVFDAVKDKDVATLIWKGVEVTKAQGGVIELIGTETGDLEWTVEWEVVESGGNGSEIPVSYKLTNPDVNENEEFSLPRVADVLIRPGVVPKAEFQNLDPNFTNWFNCNSLRSDPVLVKCAEVLVPGGEPQLGNQALIFTYQGYSEATGQTEIPGTKIDVPYTPSAQEALDGFIIKIRYQEIIATGSAWGAVSYSAVIDGRPTPSERHLVRVHMKNGDGTTCAI